MDYTLDDYGNYIDSSWSKLRENDISMLIHQLSPSDDVGILHSCGIQKVIVFARAYQQAGKHALSYDGSGLPAGIYFLKLKAGNYGITR